MDGELLAYKDGNNLPMRLIMMWLCKCANLTCMTWNERNILMKFLLSYDDYDDIRDRPYDLHWAMIFNKDIKDISKRDSSLTPSDRVRSDLPT